MQDDTLPQVTIRIRDHGPLVVEGPARVIDADGNELTIPPGKPAIALCRCGLSERKPFCDGTHKGKFDSCIREGPGE
jgi:CDGSH-type Zn-finger protein